jgi:hypothetical protein
MRQRLRMHACSPRANELSRLSAIAARSGSAAAPPAVAGPVCAAVAGWALARDFGRVCRRCVSRSLGVGGLCCNRCVVIALRSPCAVADMSSCRYPGPDRPQSLVWRTDPAAGSSPARHVLHAALRHDMRLKPCHV